MARKLYLLASVLLVGGALLAACDATVDPILDAERPFSVYGYLDPTADTQAVRVYAVDAELESAGGGELGATVTSTHHETGCRRTWRDSVVTIATGERRHVFWAPFRAEYGDRYRITVGSASGDSSWIAVRIPPRSEPAFATIDSGRAGLRTSVSGSEGVPSLIVPRLTYVVGTIPPPPPPAGPPGASPIITETLRVDLSGAQRHISGGWRFQWDMRDHFFAVRRSMERVDTLTDASIDLSYIALRTLGISYMVASDDWDPVLMEEDARMLAEPGTFSNVENGFGFVGAGYVVERIYRPPEEHENRAGFERCRPPYC